ncbi:MULTISPECIES: ribbon-helix-helix domain-containing protein [Geomonas]|uniref:hypothetical protein n=1 Tax=Geomonas TaxID=2651583 RepID=UPI00100B1E58|nr:MULTISPECIES: hypothetical protein [Geomonas]
MTSNKQPRKTYIKRGSGVCVHPNLDEASHARLLEAQEILREREQSISQSVVMRRAVRLYASYLKSNPDLNQELLLLKRAEKGVI